MDNSYSFYHKYDLILTNIGEFKFMTLDTLYVIIAIISFVICGLLSMDLSIKKGYSGIAGFFIGFFLDLFGLLYCIGLPLNPNATKYNDVYNEEDVNTEEDEDSEEDDNEKYITCKNCGFPIYPDESECSNCGTKK